MDWKQIETKWAEMARRIRADAQCGERIANVNSERLAGKSEATKNVVAKQISAVSVEIRQKHHTVSTR